MLIRPATEVSPELLGAALHEIEGRDLMVAPVDPARVYDPTTLVALEDDVITGVAWRVPDEQGLRIDIRVHPAKRRTGVGSALLEALCGDEPGPVLVSCDAGHPRARRFVEHRGFKLAGIVFFQRWDGVPADVPGAFRSADLRPVRDADAAMAMLNAAAADSWPPPVVDAAQLGEPTQLSRVAWLDGQRVGLVTARRVGDAWVTGGFAVLPAYRKRGVGRGLLADLMRAAAKEGLGVVLRVHHEAALVQAWTATLGFWTYRSWAHYARCSSVSQQPNVHQLLKTGA